MFDFYFKSFPNKNLLRSNCVLTIEVLVYENNHSNDGENHQQEPFFPQKVDQFFVQGFHIQVGYTIPQSKNQAFLTISLIINVLE